MSTLQHLKPAYTQTLLILGLFVQPLAANDSLPPDRAQVCADTTTEAGTSISEVTESSSPSIDSAINEEIEKVRNFLNWFEAELKKINWTSAEGVDVSFRQLLQNRKFDLLHLISQLKTTLQKLEKVRAKETRLNERRLKQTRNSLLGNTFQMQAAETRLKVLAVKIYFNRQKIDRHKRAMSRQFAEIVRGMKPYPGANTEVYDVIEKLYPDVAQLRGWPQVVRLSGAPTAIDPQVASRRADEERARREQIQRERQRQLASAQELIQSSKLATNRSGKFLRDRLRFDWLRTQMRMPTSTNLNLDGMVLELGESGLKELLKALAERGRLVIYDLDSGDGPQIYELLLSLPSAQRRNFIGISSNSESFELEGYSEEDSRAKLLIENIYWKALSLSSARYHLSNPKSRVGVAASIMRQVLKTDLFGATNSWVLDPSRIWSNGLRAWTEHLETARPQDEEADEAVEANEATDEENRGGFMGWLGGGTRRAGHFMGSFARPQLNMGVRLGDDLPRIFHDLGSLKSKLPPALGGDMPRFASFDLELELRHLQGDQALALAQLFQNWEQGISQIESHLAEDSQMASVFGSGRKLPPVLESTTISVLEVLFFEGGMSQANGGAGGVMDLTSAIGRRARTPVIGVPVTGRHIKYEERVGGSHSITVGAVDYDTRIPFMLHNAKVVVICPGGSGTMRELAAALVLMNPDLHIVFIDEFYYGPLYEWLKTQGIVSENDDRIHLLNGEEDARDLLVKLGIGSD